MKFNLEIGGSEGELKELIEVLQQLAKKPHIQSAVETNELENQVYMANREARKKRLLKDVETAKERADQESAPAPEPEPKSEPKQQKAQRHIDKPKAEPAKVAFTEDQVREAAKEYNAEHGGAALVKILKNLGTTCMSNLSAEKYSEFMEAINA